MQAESLLKLMNTLACEAPGALKHL